MKEENLWRIPKLEKGDRVQLIKDVNARDQGILEKGRQFTVKDVGTRYGLPFVYVEELGHDLQLDMRTYSKVEKSDSPIDTLMWIAEQPVVRGVGPLENRYNEVINKAKEAIRRESE